VEKRGRPSLKSPQRHGLLHVPLFAAAAEPLRAVTLLTIKGCDARRLRIALRMIRCTQTVRRTALCRWPAQRMHNTKYCHAFDPYLVAHQRAYAWAEKAVRFRSAGEFAQAKKAVERVNLWLYRLASLAPQPRALHRQIDVNKKTKQPE